MSNRPVLIPVRLGDIAEAKKFAQGHQGQDLVVPRLGQLSLG